MASLQARPAKEWIGKCLLSLFSVILILGLLEVCLRIYQKLQFDIPLSNNGLTQVSLDTPQAPRLANVLDDRLGWRPTPNYHFEGQSQSADGTAYTLRVTQNAYGARAFGSPNTGKTKLLVLGDSFTQAIEVSDDKTYYACLGRVLGAEVFAIGSRGYGTLQEYMLLDEFVDQIHPDLILLQFCYNDFFNNSYDLERAWTAGSLALTRPYWEKGTVNYRIPKPYGWLLKLSNKSSRLLYLVTTRMDRIRFMLSKQDSLLKDIQAHGMAHPGFRASVATTDEIMKRFASRAQDTPIVIFESCTTSKPFYDVIREIARRHRMHFVETLPADLDIAEQKGAVLHNVDRVHWNETGHRLVAEVLGEYLRSNGFVASGVAPVKAAVN